MLFSTLFYVNVLLQGGTLFAESRQKKSGEPPRRAIRRLFVDFFGLNQTIDSIPHIPQGHIPAQIPQPIQ
jgi:hypothetical protein